MVAVRNLIECFYTHLCDVYGYFSEKDDESGITAKKETLLYKDLPCRLSFELSYPLEQTDKTAVSSQRVKLFVSPDIDIPCGSKVTVTVNERRINFGYSGEQAIYSTHKEIRLKPLNKDK